MRTPASASATVKALEVIPGSSPTTSLGVTPLDLPLMRRIGVPPDAGVERA
jgi:hypothetical protein